MTQVEMERRNDRIAWCLAIALCLLTVLAFAGTTGVFFTQDDFWFLKAAEQSMPNQAMLGGALLPDYVRPLPTYWFPVVGRALWGLDPVGFHVAMLGLLGLTVLVMFRALWLRFGSLIAASAGAGLYAMCEMHLFTLGWLAGAIDVCAVLSLTLVMWAIWRPGSSRSRVWLASAFMLLAMLSKEPAVVLPIALYGAHITAVLCRRWVARDAVENDRRLLVWITVLLVGYAGMWLSLAGGAREGGSLGFDMSRGIGALLHSVVAAHPTVDHRRSLTEPWLLVPLVMAFLPVVIRGLRELPCAVFGLSLWVLPAAIFAVTTRPAALQLYHAHFCVLGLAVISAHCVSVIVRGEHPVARWLRPLALVAVATLTAVSACRRLDDVSGRRSPALWIAKMSRAADEQIRAALKQHPADHIHFLDVTNGMWWAMGKGVMIPVLYPEVTATFAGYEDDEEPAVEPPAERTSGATLVMRQVALREFEVVK